MTHVVRKLYSRIEETDCPVASFDMATDILINLGINYAIHNKKGFKVSYIKDMSVGYNPEGEFLNIYFTCDDDWTHGFALMKDKIESYREESE